MRVQGHTPEVVTKLTKRMSSRVSNRAQARRSELLGGL